MDWTFPISRPPDGLPSITGMRQLVRDAVRDLARRLRHGELPVAAVPAPDKPAAGWTHWHAWPELFLQLSGTSRFTTPLGDLLLPAGTCRIMPPLFSHHEYLGGPAADFCNLVFVIHDRRLFYHLALAWSGQRARVRVAQPDCIELDDAHLGQASLLGLSRAGDPGQEDARAGWLLAFCAWIDGVLAAAPMPGSTGSERVRRARELILSRHGSADLSVAQLGAWRGCHPDHLARSFRRETGETVVGHIRRVRLERARDLLADRSLRVADVARLVGLPDAGYFNRVYRKAFGTTPGAARGQGLAVPA